MIIPMRASHLPRILSRSRLLFALSFLTAFLAAVCAYADSRPAGQMKIEDVVKILRFQKAPTPADLARAGEDVDRVLVDLLIAKSVDLEIRLKAAKALGSYPGRRSQAVLSAIIPSRQEPSALRAAAMVALARVSGASAVDELRFWLKDDDAALRIGAAQALAVVADMRACGLLGEALEHEEVLDVRLIIDEGTKACRKGGNP